MGDLTISDIAKELKDIDFVMLNTHTDGGEIAGRPMSNNRDVEYDGDIWFFVSDDTRTYTDVARDPKVNIAAQGRKGLLGKPPIFISIEGDTEIIRDKDAIAEHWTKDLDRWWPDGPGTPGIALLRIHSTRIHYWDGENQGEIVPS